MLSCLRVDDAGDGLGRWSPDPKWGEERWYRSFVCVVTPWISVRTRWTEMGQGCRGEYGFVRKVPGPLTVRGRLCTNEEDPGFFLGWGRW